MINPTTGLPAVLSTAAVASAVSAVLAMFAPLVASIPGLREDDATRNSLLRSLVFLLTLGGLVGLAWSQGVVLTQAELPALLVCAAGGTVGTHLLYTNIRNSASTYSPVAVPPVPPVPPAPKPAPIPPPAAAAVPSGGTSGAL